MDPWLTHKWLPPEGRHFDINGKSITQHFYVVGKWEFVEDTSSGERSAVHVIVHDFTRLAEEVNARWLTEPCAGCLCRLMGGGATRHCRPLWAGRPSRLRTGVLFTELSWLVPILIQHGYDLCFPRG